VLIKSTSKNIEGPKDPLLDIATCFDIGKMFTPIAKTSTSSQQTPTQIEYLYLKPKILDYKSYATLSKYLTRL